MRSAHLRFAILLPVILWASAIPSTLTLDEAAHCRAVQFHCWTNFAAFTAEPSRFPGQVLLASPEYCPPFRADELILSWNLRSNAAPCLFEARAFYADRTSPYFQLGQWSFDGPSFRHSIPGQSNSFGHIETDVLFLRQPAQRFQIRIRHADPHAEQPEFVSITLRNRGVAFGPLTPERKAWGICLDVPQLSQLSFPGGKSWCSPTSLTMALQYWSRILSEPGLHKQVPEVAAHVFDSVYDGTGNWPFNTAYAAAFSTLAAYVARFTDISELEQWIAEKIPVITSVSLNLLRGRALSTDDGHLVVCVGFSPTGDPMINDPGSRIEIHKIIPRDQFARAWAASGNTVYLIYPKGHPRPHDRFHHWQP